MQIFEIFARSAAQVVAQKGRRAAEEGATVLARQFAYRLGVQRVKVENAATAADERHPKIADVTERVKERERRQRRVVFADAGRVEEAASDRRDVAVRKFDALRLAGRAGGEDDRQRFGRGDFAQSQLQTQQHFRKKRGVERGEKFVGERRFFRDVFQKLDFRVELQVRKTLQHLASRQDTTHFGKLATVVENFRTERVIQVDGDATVERQRRVRNAPADGSRKEETDVFLVAFQHLTAQKTARDKGSNEEGTAREFDAGSVGDKKSPARRSANVDEAALRRLQATVRALRGVETKFGDRFFDFHRRRRSENRFSERKEKPLFQALRKPTHLGAAGETERAAKETADKKRNDRNRLRRAFDER